MKKPNYYAVIAAKVGFDKRLCPSARLLFGVITSLSNKEGYCWATNQYFASLYDVSIRTITRWITKLSDFGYIKVVIDQKKGNERKIFIANFDEKTEAKKIEKQQPQNSDKKGKNVGGGIDKNIYAYNMYNNLNINNNPQTPLSKIDALFTTPEFNEMFYVCKILNKYAGKIDEAFIEYQHHLHISVKDMKFAYLCYLQDKNYIKYCGLVNFFKNYLYLNYLRPIVEITKDEGIIKGRYDKENGKLYVSDKEYYTVPLERFFELAKANQIKIINEAA
ncbi:MAG: helix-turn-helix domain-containing protein [Campylobacteraceae bacterium]|jgi:hypothetical protein|nr:helix-turn-helix domain-containing protein [Campylobacteraceae bacterium]